MPRLVLLNWLEDPPSDKEIKEVISQYILRSDRLETLKIINRKWLQLVEILVIYFLEKKEEILVVKRKKLEENLLLKKGEPKRGLGGNFPPQKERKQEEKKEKEEKGERKTKPIYILHFLNFHNNSMIYCLVQLNPYHIK